MLLLVMVVLVMLMIMMIYVYYDEVAVCHEKDHFFKRLVCMSVGKNEHFLKRVSWGPPWDTKNHHFLKIEQQYPI